MFDPQKLHLLLSFCPLNPEWGPFLPAELIFLFSGTMDSDGEELATVSRRGAWMEAGEQYTNRPILNHIESHNIPLPWNLACRRVLARLDRQSKPHCCFASFAKALDLDCSVTVGDERSST